MNDIFEKEYPVSECIQSKIRIVNFYLFNRFSRRNKKNVFMYEFKNIIKLIKIKITKYKN